MIKDIEKRKKYDKLKYQKNKEKRKRQQKEYYHKNKGKCKKYRDDFRKKNLEFVREREKEYYYKHREKRILSRKNEQCSSCSKLICDVSSMCNRCANKKTIEIYGNPMQGMTREKCPNWRGGIYKHGGYVLILKPKGHPCKEFYVLEHRLVMEQHLGRYLTLIEVVHHINEIKDDNRIENLMLFKNNSEHITHHRLKEAKNEIKNS